jgi:preprotein translocase subunit SecF
MPFALSPEPFAEQTMEFIKPGINFDFVGKMRIAFIISMVAILISIVSLVARGGPNWGIDFAGGTVIQGKFQKDVPIDGIRASLAPVQLAEVTIQQFGAREENEYLIRTAESTEDLKGLSGRIEDSLTAAFGKDGFEVRRVEVVGPKVGRDLTQKGIMAVVFSWIAMLAYIAWRFEFRFAVGGILALVHDTIITIGVFSLLNLEFSLVIVAALLTIIGYSINDTIVIYDRVRENMRKNMRQELGQVINASINQTLSRTILTVLTVVLVLASILLFGGAVIFDFAFAILVGVIVGTYSSIFIASPVVLAWEKASPARRKRK